MLIDLNPYTACRSSHLSFVVAIINSKLANRPNRPPNRRPNRRPNRTTVIINCNWSARCRSSLCLSLNVKVCAKLPERSWPDILVGQSMQWRAMYAWWFQRTTYECDFLREVCRNAFYRHFGFTKNALIKPSFVRACMYQLWLHCFYICVL